MHHATLAKAAESPLALTISNPASPTIHCSQFRVQQYLEQNGPSLLTTALSPYPTPPEAPPKDGYVSPWDSGSESASTHDDSDALAAKSSTGDNSTFIRRIRGKSQLLTLTPGCTREANMTGTRRTAREMSGGRADWTTFYAATKFPAGDPNVKRKML